MKTYVCIDIGGTSIKYGLLDGTAKFLATGETETDALAGGPAIMEKVYRIVEGMKAREKSRAGAGLGKAGGGKCGGAKTAGEETGGAETAGGKIFEAGIDGAEIAGICISTAGMVDEKEGVILHAAPHLIPDYTGMRVKELVEKRFGLPCEVENDVNCAGLAEAVFGASREAGISLCLTIGTGIGGAIIIDRKVFHGFSGSACEVGYMHMMGSTFQELGASRILSQKVAQVKAKKEPALKANINGKWIFERAKAGDEDCVKAIDEMADALGMGIANICYVLNPEMVVLGGGIMAQKEYLYDRIRNAMDRYLIPAVASRTKLAFAKNQNQAGMLGAWCHFMGRHGGADAERQN